MGKYAKGLFRNKLKHQHFKMRALRFDHKKVVVLPAIMDLRKLTAPPEDQGLCGSCWDFAITNTLRSQHMLHCKDPGSLSKNYLLFNVGPGPQEQGCYGGDFQAGQSMLSGHGPCLESLSPYESGNGFQWGGYPADAPVAATAKQWCIVGDGENRPTAQQLCEAIYNGGKGNCLSVDVAADDNWQNYSGGIYENNTSQDIDHMVRIVAYDAETSVDKNGKALFNPDGSFLNGDGHFTVRNNWSDKWGENGDMRSRFACNNLAETAMFFVV